MRRSHKINSLLSAPKKNANLCARHEKWSEASADSWETRSLHILLLEAQRATSITYARRRTNTFGLDKSARLAAAESYLAPH